MATVSDCLPASGDPLFVMPAELIPCYKKSLSEYRVLPIDDLAKVGGVIVHCLPDPETRPWHGVWAYTTEWFAELAKRCQYDLLHCERWFKKATAVDVDLRRRRRRGAVNTEWYVRVLMQKTYRSAFVGPWVQPVGKPTEAKGPLSIAELVKVSTGLLPADLNPISPAKPEPKIVMWSPNIHAKPKEVRG
jgi:hypothetical protein